MKDVIEESDASGDGLDRRAFVGMTAGVAAFGGSIAAALAQDASLGKPHPPIVAENDPAIVVEHPQLDRPGGPVDAYLAAPKNAGPKTPAIVLVMHVWGVDSQIRDVVRRYAKEGFVTIAPNLYARAHVPPGDNGATDMTAVRAASAALDEAVVHGDLLAGANYVRNRAKAKPDMRPPKVGITGFCMGGGIALRNATKDTYDAVVAFYGPLRRGDVTIPISDEQLALANRITVPMAGNYGAKDRSIPTADLHALEARLTVPHDIKSYDEAAHGFFDDTRGSYVGSAASDAWTRTLAWFRKYLTA